MAFSLTLPHLGKGTSTKDHLVSVLSYTWPLTLKQMHHEIKRRFASGVTYQAVYKTAYELVDAGVLVKKEGRYEMNLKWLKQVHDFTEVVQSNYFSSAGSGGRVGEGVVDVRGGDGVTVLSFDTWFDAEKYLYYLMKHQLLHLDVRKSICVHHRHEWRPLFYMRAEYNWIKSMTSKGYPLQLLCAGDTPADRWSAKFYRTCGVQVKTGARCADTADVIVFGDYVVQLFVPPALAEGLRRTYTQAKSIDMLDSATLAQDIFEKRAQVQMLINRDPALAAQLRAATAQALGRARKK